MGRDVARGCGPPRMKPGVGAFVPANHAPAAQGGAWPPPLSVERVGSCPLCGSPDQRPLGGVPDAGVQEINRYLPPGIGRFNAVTNELCACSACGLHYLDPRLDGPSLAALYKGWYRFAFPRIFDQWYEAQRAAEFRDYHLRFLDEVAPNRGSLLDVGTGSGAFLAVAREGGWAAEGLDLDADAVEEAGRRHGLTVRSGTLQSALGPDERFDAITMFDYLEHTTSPSCDLDTAVERLRPGGMLAVRVPNRAGWQSRLMGLGWLGIISVHLTYFDESVLRRALTNRGLEVLRVYQGNFRPVTAILSQRARWLRSRVSREWSASPAVADSAGPRGPRPKGFRRNLARLLWSVGIELVDHAGGWFQAGNNLLVLARRPL